ncbi:MAG: phosphoribosylglycinamide formyltransferase, partial [Candidatus Omnitrophica bacterium]|nr:phosphoribosylglycinamide formyltransferase [Candidatus Omnitrophota bacterium]
MHKKNIAVFASGRGSNFSAIVKAVNKGKVKGNLAILICDNHEAKVINRARRAGVKSAVVLRKDFAAKADFENKIIAILKENKTDLIVLAGFMRILSPEFVRAYSGKIINIHPSILPAFKGDQAIKDAFDYGV